MPMPLPNIIGALPGMTAIASHMMSSMFRKNGVATIPQLLELAMESGAKMIACQMTMDVMGIKAAEIIDGVEFGGAATYLDIAADSQISLFV